ncbi:MAG TPA: hypothetical protein VIW72_01835 [Burkholderiales bacterium]
MSAQSKPLGIVLIALYSGLFGLVSFPIGCTAILVSGAPGTGALFSIFSFLITAVGILLLASAYGLWTLQSWGRNFSWWLYVISIPLGAMSIFVLPPGQHMSEGNTILQLLGIAVDLVIIWYLAEPEVAALFGPEGSADGDAEYSRREPK